MKKVAFKAEKRDLSSKAAAVRKAGRIPAVLYGGETIEHFSVTHKDVKQLIYTPDFKLAEVELDGKTHNAIIQNIQYHPLRDNIVHIDFLELEDGRKVNVEIPIRFQGVSPGVKNGGSLMQSMRRVKVKLDPANMIEELFIDISGLKLGASVKVSDIIVDENVEIMVSKNIPVASVEVPRALKSAEDEAADLLLEEEAAEAAAEAGEEGATETPDEGGKD